jgi:predicted HD superfamily hydrolase involved in NAD metabolism
VNFVELAQRVRSHIGQDHRYEHSVRVARSADILAQRHRLDSTRARLAGMLHDLARLYTGERLITECESRAMPIDTFERANPVVLHARLGAVLANEMFGIDDPAILSAIAKHTVGAADMSPLDCVVYLADGLEPGRTFSQRGELWELAMADLNEGMRAMLETTFAHLARKGRPAAPQSLQAARAFGLTLPEVFASAS